MKLGKAYYVTCVTPENNWLPTKLLYTVNRIRMSPTPTLNIYLFEGPIFLTLIRIINIKLSLLIPLTLISILIVRPNQKKKLKRAKKIFQCLK
jgi:hypothetical protein